MSPIITCETNFKSEIARDFVEKCLVLDQNKRITAAKASEHPWIATYGPEKFRTKAIKAKTANDLFGIIREGLNNERSRIENMDNADTLSIASVDSKASGQTSGWGTPAHSRSGSMNNVNMS